MIKNLLMIRSLVLMWTRRLLYTIAHDDRISTKPAWMSELTDTQDDIIT